MDTNQATSRADTAESIGSPLEAGWLLIAILIPLWVNLWAQQPHEPAKAALLRVLLPVLAVVWLIDTIQRGRHPATRNEPSRRRSATATKEHLDAHLPTDNQPRSASQSILADRRLWAGLVAVWATAQIAATVAALDPNLSLWGSYERSQGLVTLLCYPLLFWIVATRLDGAAQGWRLLRVLALTGLPVALLALTQAFGFDPLGLVSDARSPAYATLGRANFVGAYLALLLPLTLAASLAETTRGRRLGWWALTLLLAAGIAVTSARGAWLAAAVGASALLLPLAWPRLTRPIRRIVAVGALLALPVGLSLLLWLGQASSGSLAARVTIWQTSLKLIAQRPWLGYGPENLVLAFPRLFPPQLVYYQGRGMLVDRAHNWTLDTLLTSGAIGLFACLAIGAAVLACWWPAAKSPTRSPERLLILACAAALIGNAAGLLVGFDVTPTATAAWLLLAVIAAQTTAATPAARPESSSLIRSPRLRTGLRIAAILAAGIWLALVASAATRFIAADTMARQAQRALRQADLVNAALAANRAAGWWPLEPSYRKLQGAIAEAQAYRAGVGGRAYLSQAEATLQEAINLRPADFTSWEALGSLYGRWAAGWDPARLAAAEDAFRHAAALAPDVATLHAAWGTAFLVAGRPAEALPHLQRAIELDATDGQAYADLGATALALGRLDLAQASFSEAARWSPSLSAAHLGLARCAWLAGHPDDALAALNRALELDPADPVARGLAAQWAARPQIGGDNSRITP